MPHLSSDEILNAVEGDGRHAAHLGACESCRARVNELRQVLQLASTIDVPEPSPLFWDHLSTRVREAVADEPQPQSAGWRFGFGWTASMVGALAIVVMAVAITIKTGEPVTPAIPGVSEIAVEVVDSGNTLASLEDDSTWALMGELASQIEWEDATAAGLIATPGSAEQALGQMSEDEQRQVVELLQLELQKSKSL